MTLLRRGPREIYRVYGEAEFFDGAADIELFMPTSVSGGGDLRLRRLAGAALLAGAVGTMCGAVVLTSSRPARGSGRRVGNGAAQALARVRLVTRVQMQLAHNPAAGASDVAMYRSAVGRARSVARARAAHLALAAGATSRPGIAGRARGEHVEHTEQREGHGGDVQVSAAMPRVDTATGSATVPTASDGAPTSIPAVVRSSSPSTTAASPPPPAPSAERAEFGFER
jgi:hypothetical protein